MTMNSKIISAILSSALLLFAQTPAFAEDIDIFASSTVPQGAPNVLIILDTTANWNQTFTYEKAALAQVISSLNAEFNLGLMLFSETGSPNTNTDGGYVRFAIQSMTDSSGGATDARNCLLKMVGAGTTCLSTNPFYSEIGQLTEKSNGGKAGTTLGEAYRYLAGTTAYSGNNKEKADPLAFTSGTIAGPTYKSPLASGSCQKNFIIVISNGPFQDNQSDTTTATNHLSGFGGSTAVINPPDNGSSANNEGDEWVRFLNKVETINAVTYALEVLPSTNGQGPYNTQLLQSMGRQGKGGYFSAFDASSFLTALTRIFNDIKATNSVFASASLPLSADNSGAYSDQIYMGVFRPDGQGNPRWMGNLKQYKFKVDTNGSLIVVDRANDPAAGKDGFASTDAVSFWTSKDTSVGPDAPATPATSSTTGSTGGFWYFDAKGTGLSYDEPDGELVEKGGAAQQLRLAHLGYANRGGIGDTNTSTLNSKPARKLYTCATISGFCANGTFLNSSGQEFDTANSAITDAKLGVSAATIATLTAASPKTVTALYGGNRVSVPSATKTGGTAVFTTSASHTFAVNNTVVVANLDNNFNGTYAITAVTSNTFSVALNGNATVSGSTTGTATVATTTATATSVAHGLLPGQRITISGATPTTFNGAFMVVAKTNDTFTYTMTLAANSNATGTILAYPNIASATTSANHGFSNGVSLTISGVTPTGYNGVYVATVTAPDAFTYNFASSIPVTSSGSGTMLASVGGGRTTLIRWVRGQDTQDENGFKVNGADTDVRGSIHPDVLHSRPVVINYGSPSTGDNPYVFYGGNDGVFRVVKGGQLTTDGKEQWGFVPAEFFGKLKRVYDNSPTVLYPSTPAGLTPTPTRRDYFWDGQTGTYIVRDPTTGAVTQALLFLTARRGGRFIYALDVTNVNNPKFLWRKGCTTPVGDNSGCDAGFDELGQTWSVPIAGRINSPGQTNPVLFFGAGYDPIAEDPDPPIGPLSTTEAVGRGIFVLDAITGDFLFSAAKVSTGATRSLVVSGMVHSIPSDVLAMDRNQTGYVDRVYVGDVGGNVWRLDTNGDISGWGVTKLASIGDRSATSSTRKFFFGPDVVVGPTGGYDAVIMATGDREHPLSSSPTAQNVVNRVYMFKDTATGLVGTNLNYSHDSSCITNCLFDATNNSTVPATAGGWFVSLATGEKAINGPIVVASEVIFGTNQPDLTNNSCTGSLGIARRYDINFETGAPAGLTDKEGVPVRYETVDGGGFLPSPIAGMVEIGGSSYAFILDNPLAKPPPPTPTFDVSIRRFRTHWREILE
jgi:type IV pilus assembly protein PilY1